MSRDVDARLLLRWLLKPPRELLDRLCSRLLDLDALLHGFSRTGTMLRYLTRTPFSCVARTPAALRRFVSHSSLTPEHSIYISESTDPYFNLTFEDW